MAPTSIREVARRAGVSVSTVSNVLNRPHLVAAETRRRVLEAIDTLGYVRNESARQLRAGRSRTIGLVVLDVANPFFTDVAHGAELLVEEHGCVLVLCNSGEDPTREARHLELLEERRVQGVLVTPVDTASPGLDGLVERGTPVVLVDRGGAPDQCSVAVDDVLGGRLAVTHLLEQGHPRVAFVGGPFSIRQVADRYQGAREALEGAGGPGTELVTVETHNLGVAEGRRAAEIIAESADPARPTAAFCANDLLALGVLQEMTRRGWGVPRDIAIVGYDDIDFAAAAAVPLSSVRQPREDLGRAAARLLLDEVDRPDDHQHRQVVFEPELVVRDSSTRSRPRPAPRRVTAPAKT